MRDSRVKGPHPRVTFFLARNSRSTKQFCQVGTVQVRNCAADSTKQKNLWMSRWLKAGMSHTFTGSTTHMRVRVSAMSDAYEPTSRRCARPNAAFPVRPEGCPHGLGRRSA